MTDRELLEMAAKAAGIDAVRCWQAESDTWTMWTADEEGRWLAEWNPLTSDADAFRLAVDLGISVQQGLSQVAVSHITLALEGVFIKEDCLDQGAWTATRRAITRAAAAIGGQK